MEPEREPSIAPNARIKAEADLEWTALCAHLSGLCSGEMAADRVRALEPAATPEQARARMLLTAEALAAADEGSPVPARALPDLSRALGMIRKGAVASGEELRDVRHLLASAGLLRRYAASQRSLHPLLAATLDSDASLDRLLAVLETAIEPDGSVSDAASPTLRETRQRVGEVRRELTARLGKLMKRYADVLRDQFWTERDGRFVLPVRSDAHLRVPGIVLGSSASGVTLYVEPQEVTALGNRLKVAEAEVEREVARVLAALSDAVRAQADAVDVALESCVGADVLAAFTRWAKETESIAVIPEGAPIVDVIAMRHPLLLVQGVPVVANDIRLEAGQALILSGPNAGGKTVALKCLGLAAYMARAGIPLPVEARSRVGWFDPVLTDVGDDQSLMKSLSTFSAHVANLGAILGTAKEHTLVLLDEVAAGTDPEEGAALATAVLSTLVEQRAAVAVTTHYERLKELGASEGPFVNASVGFDLDAMAPTFRLTLGVPGPSSALAVATRFGMPREVVARAQALLPGRALDREELMRRLEHERLELERSRRLAEEELRHQRQLSAEIEEEKKRVKERERAELAEASRELLAGVRQARAQLRQARKSLEQGGHGRDELREVERQVNEAAQQIAVGSALESATRRGPATHEKKPPTPQEIVVGSRVFLKKLGMSAEVLAPPKGGQVRVLAGSLKLSAALSDLVLDPAGGSARKAPAKKPAPQAGKVQMLDGFVPVRTSGNTLDLRGQRVEEALDAIDAFVDRMLRVGEPVAYVLHGHGTGALKLSVRAHLSASPHVAKARPAEPDDGGDAFTVFWLVG